MAELTFPPRNPIEIRRSDKAFPLPFRSWMILLSLAVLLLHSAQGFAQELDNDDVTAPIASPYVPMDSDWYRVMGRLIAAGIVDSGFVGQRPWTRVEFARMADSAGSFIHDKQYAWALADYESLTKEFAPEILQMEAGTAGSFASLDSVYLRYLNISGSPLNDSFHFGQTLYNDAGRPYGEGNNAVAGFEATGIHGRWILHARGEFQEAAAIPFYPASLVPYLTTLDRQATPLPGRDTLRQFRLLEGYAGTNWGKLAVTVGKQEFWWGPGESGPLIYSNNARSIYSLRLALRSPIILPSFLHYLGPMRLDSFFGEMPGHRSPSGPYIHGQKISFQPTRNLEFGFSRTVMFAGSGHPLTFGSFWNSFISVGDNPSSVPGSSADVGDRRGGFDFTYRVPGARQWLQLYGDFMTDDDPSPLSAPQRSAVNAGIFVSHVPQIPKLSLRFESLLTHGVDSSPGLFFYFNGAYREGYTVDQTLVGSWIGRQSQGIYATGTYEWTPQSHLELRFRNQKLSPEFIQNGGRTNDGRMSYSWSASDKLELSAFVQVEHWSIPVLDPRSRTNVSSAVQLNFRPKLTLGRRGLQP
jgi:Capsule assembly protein Wzi